MKKNSFRHITLLLATLVASANLQSSSANSTNSSASNVPVFINMASGFFKPTYCFGAYQQAPNNPQEPNITYNGKAWGYITNLIYCRGQFFNYNKSLSQYNPTYLWFESNLQPKLKKTSYSNLSFSLHDILTVFQAFDTRIMTRFLGSFSSVPPSWIGTQSIVVEGLQSIAFAPYFGQWGCFELNYIFNFIYVGMINHTNNTKSTSYTALKLSNLFNFFLNLLPKLSESGTTAGCQSSPFFYWSNNSNTQGLSDFQNGSTQLSNIFKTSIITGSQSSLLKTLSDSKYFSNSSFFICMLADPGKEFFDPSATRTIDNSSNTYQFNEFGYSNMDPCFYEESNGTRYEIKSAPWQQTANFSVDVTTTDNGITLPESSTMSASEIIATTDFDPRKSLMSNYYNFLSFE